MSSRPTKQFSLDDALLGFIGANTPPSETIDHAVRFLGTYSGTDKFLMATQYMAKFIAPFILYRAQLQFRAGKRPKPVSLTEEGLFKFAGQISAARRIMGFPNILYFIKALSALERNPPASRLILNVGRIQCLSMLVFYPLEYVSFFSAPASGPLLRISPKDALFAQLWSVRAWLVFTAFKIVEQAHDLIALLRKHTYHKDEAERAKIAKRKFHLTYALISNVVRLPVILHWSVIGGIYKNEIWTSGLSLVSALAALKGGWESTRL
ncbi:hypothetical protein MIND_01197900 [Mycena indigotica]|uniref:Uncharacterized protein n=1 Tax=Mycena indigotica TaxID=2126181 RepID=A0A8H6S535_9AGAR|nr:uncharacterized protein MIND_01197900 [Mycena indigotica]KAF7292986.1 hypothetical protein MIND_01197900 [Mycena indigotica]